MILELRQPLPLDSPKGPAIAYFVIDYGSDSHLLWVCFLVATGECGTFENRVVRMQKNITTGMAVGKP